MPASKKFFFFHSFCASHSSPLTFVYTNNHRFVVAVVFFLEKRAIRKLSHYFFEHWCETSFFCLYFILRSIRVDFLLLKWCTTFDLMLCNFSFSRRPAKFLSFLYFLIQLGWCWFINKVLNFIFLFFFSLILTASTWCSKKMKEFSYINFFLLSKLEGKNCFSDCRNIYSRSQ